MNIMDELKIKAKENFKTIVLPETMDARVLEAAQIITEEKLANIILIGREQDIISKNPNLKNLTIIDPLTSDLTESYIEQLYELRKEKGLTLEKARDFILNDNMYFSCMLIKNNKADGIVSGACHSTSNTLRPALQIIKTCSESLFVSSFMLVVVPNCQYGESGTFIFSDCGLEQNPTSEKLAAIAYDSAKNFEKLLHRTPKVAFLSHSSYGSAKHEDVDKVVEAVKIAKEKYSEYLMDGELQLDAAIIPEVAKTKAPDSPLEGSANVLVFPDLDAANISYKAVQRLAKADAYGPICQGMNAPINDLSRGCSVSDIVGTVVITAVQAIK